MPLDNLTNVSILYHPPLRRRGSGNGGGSSGRASSSSSSEEFWSFGLEMKMDAAGGGGRRGGGDGCVRLDCVASSDAFTAMWVVGLRLCLAEDRGRQFSAVSTSSVSLLRRRRSTP